MPISDFPQPEDSRADNCRRLGLQPGATIQEIEKAYWQIARELRGQGAMGPYNEAYEALTSLGHNRHDAVAEEPAAPAAGPRQEPAVARPPSKLNWPSI